MSLVKVRHDYLDLRVPIAITEIQWRNSDDATIVTGTLHHQIRKYSTKQQRRPVFDGSFGEHPIKALALNSLGNEAVASDTTGGLFSVDLGSGKVTGRFNGVSGAVSQVYRCIKSDHVVTIGVDRKLRIFEANNQRRIKKEVYLKQRLQCMAVTESDDEDDSEESHSEPIEGSLEDDLCDLETADDEESIDMNKRKQMDR